MIALTRLPVARLAGAQHPVHDRDDVGQRLARAGAGGEHVAVAAARGLDGVPLVAVEADRPPVAACGGVFLAGLEDARALRVQQPSLTRSATEPPSAKNGLSDSHGSGHWDLASRSASKNFAIRSSRMTAAPSV